MEMDEGQHTARREPNPYCPTRPTVLHCHGVNFLSNKELLSIFEEFKPQTVEWLDDSACNVIFESPEVLPEVLQSLSCLGEDAHEEDSPWTKTKEITIGVVTDPQGKAKAKAKRRTQPRTVQLELRIATEEDRKVVGHSGHTDSVFYAQVQEQQAIQKQAEETRRTQKRQRRSRLPAAAPAGEDDVMGTAATSSSSTAPATASATTHGTSSATVVPPREMPNGTASATVVPPREVPAAAEPVVVPPRFPGAAGDLSSLRLGCRGLLDPLLFMRAPAAPAASGAEPIGAAEDLGAALRQAEAEYAAVPLTTVAPKPQRAGSKPVAARGPAGQAAREQDQRGKKRRPMDQEPRPVQQTEAPRRRLQAIPPVEAFLKAHRVRCQKFTVLKTYRCIKFREQRLKKQAKERGQREKEQGKIQVDKDKMDADSVAAPEADDATSKKLPLDGLPAWDQYIRLNHHFTRHGHFMHTVAWNVQGRKVLAVVQHPMYVDLEKVANALQVHRKDITQRKLKDIEADGFPVFVCPPLGHPKDSQGRDPVLLIDSRVNEFKKPLLFDCGSVGLSIPVAEFLRSTSSMGTVVVDQLGYEPIKENSRPASVAEPAPEPAPLSPMDNYGNAIVNPFAMVPGTADACVVKDVNLAATTTSDLLVMTSDKGDDAMGR